MKNLTLTAVLFCLPVSVFAQHENGSCRMKGGHCGQAPLNESGEFDRFQDPFRRQPTEDRFDWDRNGAQELPAPEVRAPQPLVARTVSQPKIDWEQDYRKAVDESARTGLPMLIKVSAEWCGYCHRMNRETLKDPRIIRTMNSGYVAVNLDADQNRRLIEQLKVTTLPTVLVVSPDLRIMERKTGFQTTEQMATLLSRHSRRVERPTETRICQR